ncbi:hypothetical protein PS925_03615 [Pseudomonas fluorescens]|jgi:hypothetical protein|uniref:Uncharacterized protein n=2 Tax=Pseudomonas TaxID=286 RepID=A0A5E6PEL3_PSEFL|nr:MULTISPECIES: hypothetical protein [Pseudomonas]PYC19913.1 hypothetical protein DMX02_15705 [Pseudomonas jessenii]PNG43081.1 hypothetical protein A1354_22550 [Pseudomonas asplenii]QXI08075.1 hypothetical protein HU718_010345 [Pseudomonas tensinigenes]WNZ86185.1 hypothetical protein QOM10_09615 [Pseudomonas sp. P108]VVM41499.1 hypothetical protein PS619_00333 [Pseudomonas fluorescens]
MAAIGTLGPGSSDVAAMPETFKTSLDNAREAGSTEEATPTLVEGVKVSLSGASIEKAASVGGENSDIDDSGLPENIQQLLKMIRKLQKQIAEKKALIEAVMTDKRLSNEEKINKLAALRGAIAALNTGLITANLALSKVVGQSGLTSDQNLKVGSLLTKN